MQGDHHEAAERNKAQQHNGDGKILLPVTTTLMLTEYAEFTACTPRKLEKYG
eukprot:m.375792 g.375792  ORF g.375792 m.375792 type:complete len:52 (+) comp78781_c0_seq1:67-222(+)